MRILTPAAAEASSLDSTPVDVTVHDVRFSQIWSGINKCLRGMSDHQKLGITLESKVVQKLSLEKNVFTKKWSPKLLFLNDFF